MLQIVNDIAAILPPYTLEVLQDKQKRVGHRQELFGSHIKFVPLNRNKIVFPDVSELNDITFMNENVENEDLLSEDLEDNTLNQIHESERQFSGKSEAFFMTMFDAHESCGFCSRF